MSIRGDTARRRHEGKKEGPHSRDAKGALKTDPARHAAGHDLEKGRKRKLERTHVERCLRHVLLAQDQLGDVAQRSDKLFFLAVICH